MSSNQSIIHDHKTQVTPLICVHQYQAMRRAMKAARVSAATLDLDLLIILYEATAPLTFQSMYCAYNRPDPNSSKFTYYAALERLHLKGFVSLEYNVKGWRLWSITPQGLRQVQQLDTAAQDYLPL